jgi:hypothetical protein
MKIVCKKNAEINLHLYSICTHKSLEGKTNQYLKRELYMYSTHLCVLNSDMQGTK